MWSLDQLVKTVDGRLVHIESDEGADGPSVVIQGAATISNAGRDDITFVTSRKYLKEFESGPAAAAIVCTGLESEIKPCIEVDQPEEAFAKIVKLFRPAIQRPKIGISPDAIVSPTARISDDVCELVRIGRVVVELFASIGVSDVPPTL